MKKHIIYLNNNRVTTVISSNKLAVTQNSYILENLPPQSIMGALFDPATKTFTFDEEYDAIQTAINTPPAEPEVSEPPAE